MQVLATGKVYSGAECIANGIAEFSWLDFIGTACGSCDFRSPCGPCAARLQDNVPGPMENGKLAHQLARCQSLNESHDEHAFICDIRGIV